MATSQDPLACEGDSERSKKERTIEEDNIKEEGSRRLGRVERYWCNVICGAPKASKIKGLR